jgi:hypothetical protein
MGYRLFGLKYRGSIAITVFLHVLLWGSVAVFVIAVDIFSVAYMDVTLRPPAILMLISVSKSVAFASNQANVAQCVLSVLFLAFHNLTARRRVVGFLDEEPVSRTERPTWIGTRLLIGVCIMWLVTSGANLVVASRQPLCFRPGYILAYWQFGGTCIAQRVGTGISIIVL